VQDIFAKLHYSVRHLETLHDVFLDKDNFQENSHDYSLYMENAAKLNEILTQYNFGKQLYDLKDRQMILADVIEYIFLGRGYYMAAKGRSELQGFLKTIMYFVNLLMSYETITVEDRLRTKFLDRLSKDIPQIRNEVQFDELLKFQGRIGLPRKDSDASGALNRYFDSFLPKTAGGLWHELLVYSFLLRYDFGYVIPLVLSQRFLSKFETVVPPDFLVITKSKNLYGIEVGMKKEIQSGSFSLETDIPTATIDTINSRSSDRCPICKRWIMFCQPVIDSYCDLEYEIKKAEVRCLNECSKYSEQQILQGACPYTKYRRMQTNRFHHKYTDGLHYHYRCVLQNLDDTEAAFIKESRDEVALKTHYPDYAGLGNLLKSSKDYVWGIPLDKTQDIASQKLGRYLSPIELSKIKTLLFRNGIEGWEKKLTSIISEVVEKNENM